jgi:hypothetical protein
MPQFSQSSEPFGPAVAVSVAASGLSVSDVE